MKRDDAFASLARHITDEIVVATYSSAVEWNELNPRVLNYFSMGAMGLASSHGLGLALGRPDKRIVVLDGDGSLLMNLGSLVTIGAAAPKNLVHFVCNNGCYEANGGHPIPNPKVDFSGLARVGGLCAHATISPTRTRSSSRSATCSTQRARCSPRCTSSARARSPTTIRALYAAEKRRALKAELQRGVTRDTSFLRLRP